MFRARISGGIQPISNGSIQLYTPGTNGYGSASTPLLNQPVTTDANGSFSFGGDFSCPSPTTPVYLVATGGNPGLAPGTNNSAIALMGLLGQCGTLTSTSFFNIGERSTVAAVWALAPFMVDYAHIGTSHGNVQGLLNAFTAAQNLVDIHSGSAPGTAPAIATHSHGGDQHSGRHSHFVCELRRHHYIDCQDADGCLRRPHRLEELRPVIRPLLL